VSRKRSTQWERQDSSEREKRVEGVPATHLVFSSITGERNAEISMNVLVPTHASHFVDRFLDAGLGLFLFDELGDFLLERGVRWGLEKTRRVGTRTFVASSNLSMTV